MTDGKVAGMTGHGGSSHGGGDFSAGDGAGHGVPEKRQEYRYDETSQKGAGNWKSEEPVGVPEFGGSPFSQPFEQPKSPLDQVGKTSTMPEAFEDKEKDLIEDKETDESVKTPINEDVSPQEAIYGGMSKEEGGSQAFEREDPLSSGFPGAGVEVADVSGSSSSDKSGIEVQDDSISFLEMMREAGITKKHIFMVLGVFGFAVAVVLFFVFGGYRFVTDLISGNGKVPVAAEESVSDGESTAKEVKAEETVPVEEVKTEESSTLKDATVPPSFDQIFALSGLVNSYIFGLEFSKYSILQGLNTSPVSAGGSMVGVEASIAVGKSAEVNKNSITYYADLLRRIDEARKINLYDYLNKFVDRRKALQDHLIELNQLVMEADSNRSAILQELERINTEYKAVGEQKGVFEKSFFDSLNSYHGEGAYDNLELFVEASQRQIKDKAYYNTLKTFSDMLGTAISALNPRIQDISVNAEALIKGVRVFEVQGSNIDAIIIQNGVK
jgi:hypothetical protein